MKKLNNTGYYLSEPSQYEDWHAGHKIEYINYFAYYFKNNGKAYMAAKTENNSFSLSNFLSDGEEVDYIIENNLIEIILDKGSRFEVRNQLTILGIDLIVDNGVKYKWTTWPQENHKSEL